MGFWLQDKPESCKEVLPSKSCIYSYSGVELCKDSLCGLTLSLFTDLQYQMALKFIWHEGCTMKQVLHSRAFFVLASLTESKNPVGDNRYNVFGYPKPPTSNSVHVHIKKVRSMSCSVI